MSFYFAFEKRISQSVRIVYQRGTRIAINNSSIIAQVSDLNCTFAKSEGRNPRSRKRFLLLPENRNRQNFSKKGRNNAALILFAYMQSVYSHHRLYTFSSYMLQRGVFVSQFIFLRGVWRYQIFDECDKSLRFSCIYNQAQIINADFGRLIGNMDGIVYGRGFERSNSSIAGWRTRTGLAVIE